jgi:hypothetical protein
MIGYVMPWLLTHSLLLCGMYVRISMPHDVASEDAHSSRVSFVPGTNLPKGEGLDPLENYAKGWRIANMVSACCVQ